MHTEQIVGVATVAVLGVIAAFAGVEALAQPGGGGPACLKRIKPNTHMDSMEDNCASYTDCDSDYECVTGTQYNNCGPAGQVYAWCGDYENGYWDSELGRCVGGHMPGSYYFNGFVSGYESPVFCGNPQ